MLGSFRDGTKLQPTSRVEQQMCRDAWGQNCKVTLGVVHSCEVPLVPEANGRASDGSIIKERAIDLLASSIKGYPVVIEAKWAKDEQQGRGFSIPKVQLGLFDDENRSRCRQQSGHENRQDLTDPYANRMQGSIFCFGCGPNQPCDAWCRGFAGIDRVRNAQISKPDAHGFFERPVFDLRRLWMIILNRLISIRRINSGRVFSAWPDVVDGAAR